MYLILKMDSEPDDFLSIVFYLTQETNLFGKLVLAF